jgi:short-subunit dehydrogenase
MTLPYRSAVITGASSGIGAELARQLAAQGVPVGLTARRAETLEALAAEIRRAGGTAVVAPADAGDRAATHAAIGRIAEALGPIDLLIANAGLGLGTAAFRFDAEDFERMVRVNLLGAAYAIEAVLPEMLRRRRGHLVGVSSIAAYRGIPGSAGYCATKAGLSALLEGLRAELRHQHITVTTVHPGFIDTPMTEGGDGPQPFKMGVDRAARIILRGIASRRREVNFPRRMVALMSLARHLPNALADRILTSPILDRGEPAPPTTEEAR